MICYSTPGPVKNPGTRRRTAARTVQDRAGAENSSGRSDSRKREMEWLRDYCTNQGMAARQRAYDRWHRGSQPRDQKEITDHRKWEKRAYPARGLRAATNENIFSTQYSNQK